jgi:haloalkane dehalogenase
MTRKEFETHLDATRIAGMSRVDAGQTRAADLDARWFHQQRRQVELDGKMISYVEHGMGQPVLLLHGWPLNGFQWRKVMALLGEQYRCIVPDFMGLGYSEVDEAQDLSPIAQANMLAEFLQALELPAIHLVANDSGTAVAQLLAVKEPSVIRTMLLTNGDVHTNSPPEALRGALEAAARGELVDIFALHLSDTEFSQSPMGLGSICYSDASSLTPEAMEVYFRPFLANERRRLQCQQYGLAFKPNPMPEIAGALEKLTIPVRMVWGDADVHFGTEWANWLDEKLPGSQGVRVVKGGKLFFPEEKPLIVAQEADRLFKLVTIPT